MSVGEAGELANLTRNAFHVLRGRWSAERSLASVVPFAGRRPRRAVIGDRTVESSVLDGGPVSREIEAAKQLLMERPDLSNGALGRLLAERLADGSHTNAMSRLMQRVRRTLRLQPDAIRSTYGRSLVVDHSAIALLVLGPDGPECAVASLVLERASGLLLAARVSSRDNASTALHEAVRLGSLTLGDSPLDVRAQGSAKVTVVMPPGRPAPINTDWPSQTEMATCDYVDQGARRYGARTISTIGARIGRIRLVPRFTAEGTGLPMMEWGHHRTPLEVSDANEIFEKERIAWNSPILPRLEAAGLAGSINSRGGISDMLRRVVDDLAAAPQSDPRH